MFQIIKNDLKIMLSNYRYEHSLLVAEEAKLLAKHYNLNYEKAYLSGLVHDIAKDLSDEENNYWIDKYNIDKTFIEYKPVLHAEIGYYLVKEKYNLDDEICYAIRYHSLGNINMSLFDKIIFIADKIGRKNRNDLLDNIKLLAYQDIDKAMILYLNYQKDKLIKDNKLFHNDSEDLLNYLSM